VFLISSTSTSLTLCITRVLGEEDDKFDKAEAAATAREAQAQNERTMHANEAREDRETKQNELLARLDEQADLGKQILEQLLTPAKGPRFALDSNVVQDDVVEKTPAARKKRAAPGPSGKKSTVKKRQKIATEKAVSATREARKAQLAEKKRREHSGYSPKKARH